MTIRGLDSGKPRGYSLDEIVLTRENENGPTSSITVNITSF